MSDIENKTSCENCFKHNDEEKRKIDFNNKWVRIINAQEFANGQTKKQ